MLQLHRSSGLKLSGPGAAHCEPAACPFFHMSCPALLPFCSGDPNSGYPADPSWKQLTLDEAMGLLLKEGAFGTSPELAKHIGES